MTGECGPRCKKRKQGRGTKTRVQNLQSKKPGGLTRQGWQIQTKARCRQKNPPKNKEQTGHTLEVNKSNSGRQRNGGTKTVLQGIHNGAGLNTQGNKLQAKHIE